MAASNYTTAHRKPKQTKLRSDFKDLSGQKFGRLFVIRYVERWHDVSAFACRCDCGATIIARSKCAEERPYEKLRLLQQRTPSRIGQATDPACTVSYQARNGANSPRSDRTAFWEIGGDVACRLSK